MEGLGIDFRLGWGSDGGSDRGDLSGEGCLTKSGEGEGVGSLGAYQWRGCRRPQPAPRVPSRGPAKLKEQGNGGGSRLLI